MYTVAAASACREERWSDACQALYRVSVVYSALQDTLSASMCSLLLNIEVIY